MVFASAKVDHIFDCSDKPSLAANTGVILGLPLRQPNILTVF
jgi:hypothetical protein